MSTRSRIFFSAIILHSLLQSIAGSHGDPVKVNNPSSAPQYPCIHPHQVYSFCNTSLPINARAQSLISLLNLDEKIQQLSNNASAVPRLGIPPFEWWSESLHGLATNGPGVSFNGVVKAATSFPQVILAAASYNRSLWRAMASAIGVEAMAMHNVGQAGLTFWAPNVNIFRDPRWGRGQETPGEDPMVAAAFAVEFVRGFQEVDYGGDGRRRVLGYENEEGGKNRLRLSACCKHLTAYDLEKWGQFNRYNFNAIVTAQDMSDTYQVPFRSCVQQGEASCLMCSYNSVNGIPACANREILQKARTDWNFKGYITSDCDAVATIYEDQKYSGSPEDAVAAALKAGTDINCGTYMLRHMPSAVERGKVSEEDIDRALLNLFSVQVRLGLFDGESARDQYRELGPKDICSQNHRILALEATLQGIVLLKNDHKFLPLNKNGMSSLAVLGPLANSTDLGGGYSGIPCKPVSIVEGFQEHIDNVYYASGCLDTRCNSTTDFAEALSVSKRAKHVIIVAGVDLTQETEDLDRYSLLLPGYQMALITAVAEATKNPLVLVLTGGGPIDVSFAIDDPRIGSILWIGYPGETGGEALPEIIFGNCNPSGKLPVTWYPEAFTKVPMSDMNMRADPSRNYPGRTYRFYRGDVVYGFGHGLSYTEFTYKLVSAPSELSFQGSMKPYQRENRLGFIYVDEIPFCSSFHFQVHISVTNNGDREGEEAVLLFSKFPEVSKGSPQRQLIGFERIGVAAYGTTDVQLLVDACEHLSFADENGDRVVAFGDHILMSGNIEHVISIEY